MFEVPIVVGLWLVVWLLLLTIIEKSGSLTDRFRQWNRLRAIEQNRRERLTGRPTPRSINDFTKWT